MQVIKNNIAEYLEDILIFNLQFFRSKITKEVCSYSVLFVAILAISLLSATEVHAANSHYIYANTFDDDYEDNGNRSLREAIMPLNTKTDRDACPFNTSSPNHRKLLW